MVQKAKFHMHPKRRELGSLQLDTARIDDKQTRGIMRFERGDEATRQDDEIVQMASKSAEFWMLFVQELDKHTASQLR